MPGAPDPITSGADLERAVALPLHSTGKAVAFEDLRGWLSLFGLPDTAAATRPGAPVTLGGAGGDREPAGD